MLTLSQTKLTHAQQKTHKTLTIKAPHQIGSGFESQSAYHFLKNSETSKVQSFSVVGSNVFLSKTDIEHPYVNAQSLCT